MFLPHPHLGSSPPPISSESTIHRQNHTPKSASLSLQQTRLAKLQTWANLSVIFLQVKGKLDNHVSWSCAKNHDHKSLVISAFPGKHTAPPK